MKSVVLLLVFLISSAEQRSTPQDDHYVAAVVEYAVSRNVEHNKEEYIRLIKEAADQLSDIVVFPELTLTNATTSFEVPINGRLLEYPVPAEHPDLYDDLLVSMSEAAKANQIYVVFNTRELVDCIANNSNENCPEAKRYIFNTNVVLDRSGAVIDRYRKINLFGEAGHTSAFTPDLGVFRTDFGVTFGHFICFDLMFQVPAIQVVQKNRITDIVFTTMWFSELPYLTAVEIQEAYAYALDVNFLAAGANNPAVGSAGSGIFSGKAGALVSIMPGVSTTRLLVSKVPKIPGQVTEPSQGPIYDPPSVQDGLHLITDPSLVAHKSRLLVEGLNEFTLQDKDVTCSFRVNMDLRSGDAAPYYRAIVKDDTNTYSRREMGVSACSIVACKGTDFKSCAHRFDAKKTKTGIKELEISMKTYSYQYDRTLSCDNVIYFPISLTASKFPLASTDITFIVKRSVETPNEITKANENKIAFWNLNEKDSENDKNIEKYKYRAASFSGVRSFSGVATGGSRVCSVVACTGDTMDTCGRRFNTYTANSTALFRELSITATVPTPIVTSLEATDSYYFPTSMKTSIMPLEPEDYTYSSTVDGATTTFKMNLVNLDEDLYSFSVWGRVFESDGQDADPAVVDSASINVFSWLLLGPVVALVGRY